MPAPKPPMKRRKVPAAKPAAAPDVTPAEEKPTPVNGEVVNYVPPPKMSGSKKKEVEGEEAPKSSKSKSVAGAKRKKTHQISHSVRRMLMMDNQQFAMACAQPGTQADAIAANLVNSAVQGTMDAIKIVYERTEGRVPQSLEVSTNAVKDVHERVNDIARDRANAAAIAATGGLPEDDKAVDMPKDGTESPQGDSGKPGVES